MGEQQECEEDVEHSHQDRMIQNNSPTVVPPHPPGYRLNLSDLLGVRFRPSSQSLKGYNSPQDDSTPRR